jgi:hypothetical protein
MFIVLCWYIVQDLLMVEEQAPTRGLRAQVSNLKRLVGIIPFNKLRIPVVVLQILTQFIAITGAQMPPQYRKFIRWINVINLDMQWLLSVGCVVQITFYGKLLLTTLLPLLVVAVLGIIHMTVCYKHRTVRIVHDPATMRQRSMRTDALERAVAKHSQAFLLFTFLIFPTVSTVVFQTLACDYLEDTQQNWLRADYSVSCDTAIHKAYQAYAAFMILVYPIGIPALYAYLLWQHRAHLHTKDDSSVDRELDLTLQTTRFLWSTYKPYAYWWELVECVRRLLMTGFLVFILPGTAGQSAVSCAFAVLSIAVFSLVQPLRESSDTYSYWLGCAVLFLSMFVALVTQGSATELHADSQQVLSVLLIALNVVLIITAAVQMGLAVQIDNLSFYGFFSKPTDSTSNDTTIASNDDSAQPNEVDSSVDVEQDAVVEEVLAHHHSLSVRHSTRRNMSTSNL